MKKSKKWAEQALVEEPFRHKDENGNEVEGCLNVLNVCLSDKELYRKEFIEGKYRGKTQFLIPYEFIVETGDMCPKGKFYELEYFIGESGIVYRALIQAVDPVADIQLILGTLRYKNLLPVGFKPLRAFLRSDIDAVNVGHCSKDENGEACFIGGMNKAGDGTLDDGSRLSVLKYAIRNAVTGCCLYYYRGDCRELWVPGRVDCSADKVFVCGVNGNDPDFADQRKQAIDRLDDLLEEAKEIIADYNLPHFVVVSKDGGDDFTISCNLSTDTLKGLLNAIIEHDEKQQ